MTGTSTTVVGLSEAQLLNLCTATNPAFGPVVAHLRGDSAPDSAPLSVAQQKMAEAYRALFAPHNGLTPPETRFDTLLVLLREKPHSFLENVWARINPALAMVDGADLVWRALERPTFSNEFQVPIRRDDGTTVFYPGFRAQYRTRLPTKGGTRWNPRVTKDIIEGLALEMAVKVNVVKLPYGGAKGGIVVDPGTLSSREQELLARNYLRAMKNIVGPDRDVPAPDMGTTSQHMDWMANEWQHLNGGNWEPSVITGKSVGRGGIVGRTPATGQGGFDVLQAFLADQNVAVEGCRIAVQGFGNVGGHFARISHEAKMKIVAISDIFGTVYNPDGLDIPALLKLQEEHKPLPYTSDDTQFPLTVGDVQVIVPAALEGQITRENAGKIQAKYILELANGPVEADADSILEASGIICLPDVLSNAGGVTVSYYEWVQGRTGEEWDLARVNAALKNKMVSSYQAIRDVSRKRDIPLRQAAFVSALQSMTNSMASIFSVR